MLASLQDFRSLTLTCKGNYRLYYKNCPKFSKNFKEKSEKHRNVALISGEMATFVLKYY